MTTADEQSGITQLVHGNEQDARELRANLSVFARRTDNPEITRIVGEVLSGRRNVREIFRTKEFTEAVGAGLDKVEEGLAELSDEERAELWDKSRPRTPRARLEALRGGDDGEDGEPVLRIRSF